VKNQKKNLRKVVSKFNFYEEVLDTGTTISVKDGVARVNELFGVLSGGLVQLGIEKVQGTVLSLEHNTVSIKLLSGKVIDALGNTIDVGPKVTSFLIPNLSYAWQ